MRFLMCAPEFFGVEYVINPWMQGNLGQVSPEAKGQWENLHQLLTETLEASVELLTPQAGLPDMVFTANAGLIQGEVVVPSRFRHAERQGEEPYFHAWFMENGLTIQEIPAEIAFEGEGDALFDYTPARVLWAADGFRSDAAVHPYLTEIFGVEVVPLKLVDARYYHLDTCFTPLPRGLFLWYPPAFDTESQARVEARIPATNRHALSETDAVAFAANAIPVGADALVLNRASPALIHWLKERGFTVYATPLTEFIKAGGSAKCLVLRLP